MSIQEYRSFYRRSIDNPEEFWAEQAQAIDWHKDFEKALDFGNPPFAKWYVGGETNLCHNAVDRHSEERGPTGICTARSPPLLRCLGSLVWGGETGSSSTCR